MTQTSYWSDVARAAGARALRTAAQAALAVIGTGAAGVIEVDWRGVLSATALAVVTSVLMSLVGMPEVDAERRLAQADATTGREA